MNNFQVEKIVEKLKKEHQKTFVLRIDKFNRPLVMVNRLAEVGKVEQHDWACDVTCILEGEGKFERGGKIVDKFFRSKGEWRGTALTGNKTFSLKPGIVIITETGIPHKIIPKRDSTLIFITYKHYLKNYKIL